MPTWFGQVHDGFSIDQIMQLQNKLNLETRFSRPDPPELIRETEELTEMEKSATLETKPPQIGLNGGG